MKKTILQWTAVGFAAALGAAIGCQSAGGQSSGSGLMGCGGNNNNASACNPIPNCTGVGQYQVGCSCQTDTSYSQDLQNYNQTGNLPNNNNTQPK